MQAFSEDIKQGLMGGMKESEKFFHILKEFHSVHVIRSVPAEFCYILDQVSGPDGDPTVASPHLSPMAAKVSLKTFPTKSRNSNG